MAKRVKLKNDMYLDTKYSVHNNTILYDYLNNIDSLLQNIIKVIKIASDEINVQKGNYYNGSVKYTVPSGYSLLAIIPSHTTYGDVNVVTYNVYEDVNRIYFQLYCRWSGEGKVRTNFRIYFIKTSVLGGGVIKLLNLIANLIGGGENYAYSN